MLCEGKVSKASGSRPPSVTSKPGAVQGLAYDGDVHHILKHDGLYVIKVSMTTVWQGPCCSDSCSSGVRLMNEGGNFLIDSQPQYPVPK